MLVISAMRGMGVYIDKSLTPLSSSKLGLGLFALLHPRGLGWGKPLTSVAISQTKRGMALVHRIPKILYLNK